MEAHGAAILMLKIKSRESDLLFGLATRLCGFVFADKLAANGAESHQHPESVVKGIGGAKSLEILPRRCCWQQNWFSHSHIVAEICSEPTTDTPTRHLLKSLSGNYGRVRPLAVAPDSRTQVIRRMK